MKGWVIAILLVATAAWFAWPDPAGQASDYEVVLVWPDATSSRATVVLAADEADALGALLAFARQADLEVVVDGMRGPCSGMYVRGIGGHQAQGAAGWVYDVKAPGADWYHPPRGAACHPLAEGDIVRWRWTDAPQRD